MVIVPLYVPAACAPPGVTVPPTHTKSAPAALNAVGRGRRRRCERGAARGGVGGVGAAGPAGDRQGVGATRQVGRQREGQIEVRAGLTGEVETAGGRCGNADRLRHARKDVAEVQGACPGDGHGLKHIRGRRDVGALGRGGRSPQTQDCGDDCRYSGGSAHCPSLALVKEVVSSDYKIQGMSVPWREGRATYVPRVN